MPALLTSLLPQYRIGGQLASVDGSTKDETLLKAGALKSLHLLDQWPER